MNGAFPIASLSNNIIFFARFYQIGRRLAVVAVVSLGHTEKGTHKCFTPAQEIWNGKRGLEWKTLSWPIAERHVNRRSSQELALATGMIGVRGSSATRVLPDLRLEKTTKQVKLRVLQVD